MHLCTTVQHTSASLTLNENYDSDVRDDTETFLNKVVPEVGFFIHGYMWWHVLLADGVNWSKFIAAGTVCTMETYTGR